MLAITLSAIQNALAKEIITKCNIKFPGKYSTIQANRPSTCNNKVGLVTDTEEIEKNDPKAFEALVQKMTLRNNNVDGSRFIFSDKTTKTVYRSSFLSDSPACISSLVDNAKC